MTPRHHSPAPVVAFTLLAVSASALFGQTVIGISSTLPTAMLGARPAPPQLGTGTPYAPSLSSITSALKRPDPFIQAGPFAVRPHLAYELVSGNGILRIPGQAGDFTRHTVSGGASLEAGSLASADYDLARVMYSRGGLDDATNHKFRAQTEMTLDDLRLGISGSYSDISNVFVETGAQTREKTTSGQGSIAYQLGRSTEIEVIFGASDRTPAIVAGAINLPGAGQITRWTKWSASTWLRRNVSQHLTLAAGLDLGYDEIAHGPDMSHTTPQFQLNWRATKKASLRVEYGIERRLYKPIRTETNNRYSANIIYNPFSTSTFSAGVSQRVDPSYLVGETSNIQGWNIDLQQRLLTRFFLSLGTAKTSSTYNIPQLSNTTNRKDRYILYSARLGTTILRKASINVFYQRSRNRSTSPLFNFTSNQVGAEIAYRF